MKREINFKSFPYQPTHHHSSFLSIIPPEDSILDYVEILKDATKQWINETPSAFFPSCYLNESLEEVRQ